MKPNFFRAAIVVGVAAVLVAIPSAHAAFTQIPLPDTSYTSSTTLIPITGMDGDTLVALSDANVTVTFSTAMQEFTVPGTWTHWSSPPNAETSTPRVLSPVDYLNTTSVTLT